MRVAGGIIGIIAGLFGVFGGMFTSLLGGVAGSQTQGDAEAQAGAVAVVGVGLFATLLSGFITLLGIAIFFNPKIPSILMILSGLVVFLFGNYFSAPFAILAGIFGLVGANQEAKATTA